MRHWSVPATMMLMLALVLALPVAKRGGAELRVFYAPLRSFRSIACMDVNKIVSVPTVRTAQEARVRHFRATPACYFMEVNMGGDIEVIAIASCSLFIIGIGLWVALSGIKARLDKIIELLQSRP